MINDPLITVYIVNRNYGKYLDNAFKSVLNQTFKSLEIIIILRDIHLLRFGETQKLKITIT